MKTILDLKTELLEGLYPNGGYDIVDNKVYFFEGVPEILTTDESVINSYKDTLVNKLVSVCDEKTSGTEQLILGKALTIQQQRRYEAKEYLAKNNPDGLTLEATLLGMSTGDLASLVIKISDGYKKPYREFLVIIDAVRVALAYQINTISDLDGINSMLLKIENIKTLGANSTPTEIINMVKG